MGDRGVKIGDVEADVVAADVAVLEGRRPSATDSPAMGSAPKELTAA
jgi:hypothetical protein